MLDILVSQPQSRPKSLLSEDDVCRIFLAGKPCAKSATRKLWTRGQILALAKKFQVTPKTIRDIWNRRTWKNTTSHLIECNSALLNQQVKLETKQHLSGHACTSLGPQGHQSFKTFETFFMPAQHQPSTAPEIDIDNCTVGGPSQTRRRPDLCLEPHERFAKRPQSCEEKSFRQQLCFHWPGDALLLAVAAHNHSREAENDELPTQGGAAAGVSAADPFAGDWTY